MPGVCEWPGSGESRSGAEARITIEIPVPPRILRFMLGPSSGGSQSWGWSARVRCCADYALEWERLPTAPHRRGLLLVSRKRDAALRSCHFAPGSRSASLGAKRQERRGNRRYNLHGCDGCNIELTRRFVDPGAVCGGGAHPTPPHPGRRSVTTAPACMMAGKPACTQRLTGSLDRANNAAHSDC